MLNNDILRRLRFAIDFSDPKIIACTEAGGRTLTRELLSDYLKKESEEGMQACPDDVLAAFLNGLIVERRGARGDQPPPEAVLDNNKVLKKLRVAFSLRDDDVQALLASADMKLSRSELNALFRNPDHKNYKACGDQVLRNILSGLTRQNRPDQAE